MLTIGYRFIAGQYHATPWGRHVNEGDTEWPPSPWRILRAVLAVWHVKAADDVDARTVTRLIDALSSELPLYAIPVSTGMHTRHYMPSRDGHFDKSTLVFDGARRLAVDAWLSVVWPSVELDAEQTSALDLLLARTAYLGRAESWVEARRLTRLPAEINGRPDDASSSRSRDSSHVQLLAPITPDGYREWRARYLSGQTSATEGRRRRVMSAPPQTLLEAIEMNTGQLSQQGWNQPPGSQWVTYRLDLPRVIRRVAPRLGESPAKPTTARLILTGKPLPRLTDAVTVGETLRRALIAQASRLGPVPSTITGRDDAGTVRRDGHRHAFFLAEDEDADGFVDHIIVYAAEGFPQIVVAALDRLPKLYTARDETEWGVVLEGIGPLEAFRKASPVLTTGRVWESRTPYLHPWHQKKHGLVGPEAQIRRELRARGLPEPIRIEWLPELTIRGKALRAIQFRRIRSTRHGPVPDRIGSFWRIYFPEAISGPLTLGYGCHYGLGLFQAVRRDGRELQNG